MNIKKRSVYPPILVMFVISCASRGAVIAVEQVDDSDMLCIAEDFEYWICHWPDQPGVAYSLTVTALKSAETSYDCDVYCGDGTCHCYVPDGHVFPFFNHTLELNATSGTRSVVSHFLRYFVIPMARSGPVADLDVEVVDSTTLITSWDRPSDLSFMIYDYELVYIITYHSQWGESVNVTVTQPRVVLGSLRPHTVYSLHVRANILGSPHPGNDTVRLRRTLAAEPTESPVLVTYRRLVCGNNSSCVLVYWQPIPTRHQNGDMQEYIITMSRFNAEYDDVNITLTPAEGNAALFNDIDPHASYNVSIQGRNNVGLSPQHVMSFVPEDEEPFMAFFGESRHHNTVLNFSWRHMPKVEQLLLMSVLCPDEDNAACQTNMETTILDPTAGHYSLPNPEPHRRYGAVAMIGGANSGFGEEWACLYTDDGEPAVPSLSVVDSTTSSISVNVSRGACAVTLEDNRGLTLSIELMYDDDLGDCKSTGTVFWHWEGVTFLSDGPFYHTLEDLSPDTEYNLCLQAVGRKQASQVVTVKQKTDARKFSNTAIAVSVLVAIAIVALVLVGGIVKVWFYTKDKLKIVVEKPPLDGDASKWKNAETETDTVVHYENRKETLCHKVSQDSGFHESGSGCSSGYSSSCGSALHGPNSAEMAPVDEESTVDHDCTISSQDNGGYINTE